MPVRRSRTAVQRRGSACQVGPSRLLEHPVLRFGGSRRPHLAQQGPVVLSSWNQYQLPTFQLNIGVAPGTGRPGIEPGWYREDEVVSVPLLVFV